MQKLLELEKKLREAKAQLEKNGTRFSGAGSTAATGGASIASQIGFGKAEEDKDEDKKDKKKIAEALDRHNEKKHGEDKDEDSAQKDAGLKKSKDNKFGNQQEAKRTDAMNSARQVATEIDPKTGSKKAISPESQVKAKVDSAAEKKSKAEAEAAARRASYKQDGVLKADGEKGVHMPTKSILTHNGTSEAGKASRSMAQAKELNLGGHADKFKAQAIDAHKKVLGEMKAQPAPKLVKQELIKFDKNGQWSVSKEKDEDEDKDDKKKDDK